MELVFSSVRITLAIILLSSFGWKVANFRAFISSLASYHSLVFRTLSVVTVLISEVLFGGGLLIIAKGAEAGAILLFCAFTGHLVWTLTQPPGQGDSCGCGGLLGNHTTHWWMIVRNFILIGMTALTWLYSPQSYRDIPLLAIGLCTSVLLLLSAVAGQLFHTLFLIKSVLQG